MQHRGLSGWPVIIAAVLLFFLILLNLAVYGYRQPAAQTAVADPQETRIEALEKEVAALRRQVHPTSRQRLFMKRDPQTGAWRDLQPGEIGEPRGSLPAGLSLQMPRGIAPAGSAAGIR